MCVIISKPKGKILTIEEIEKAWDRNPDGGGLVYVSNKKFKLFKSLNKAEYIRYIKKIDQAKYNILFHMRIKTHGAINIDNTHPFKVRDYAYFAHNGVITPEGGNKDKLDTLEFRDNILNNLPVDWYENDAIKKMMSEYIGYSKLSFLLINDTFVFINENKGEWDNGIWYSNKRHTVTTTVTTSHFRTDRQTTIYDESDIKGMTSKDILNKALDGKLQWIDITKRFNEYEGTVCIMCGLPLLTTEEKRSGICKDCLESFSEYYGEFN